MCVPFEVKKLEEAARFLLPMCRRRRPGLEATLLKGILHFFELSDAMPMFVAEVSLLTSNCVSISGDTPLLISTRISFSDG